MLCVHPSLALRHSAAIAADARGNYHDFRAGGAGFDDQKYQSLPTRKKAPKALDYFDICLNGEKKPNQNPQLNRYYSNPTETKH
jgi:hypothetical protein